MVLQASQVPRDPMDHLVLRDLPEMEDQLDPMDWTGETAILETLDPRDHQ